MRTSRSSHAGSRVTVRANPDPDPNPNPNPNPKPSPSPNPHLGVRALGEDVARDEDVRPAEVDAEIDHDQVSDEHVEDHGRAVGVPAVPAAREELREEEEDGRGHHRVEHWLGIGLGFGYS